MRRELSDYLQAVLDKDANSARSVILSLLQAGMEPIDVFEMLGRSQVEIGDLWEAKTISVADEHFATQAVMEAVSIIEGLSRRADRKVGNAVVFSCEGEFHNVGLTFFSSLLKFRGWSVESLGVDAKISTVVHTIKNRGKVDLLCVSITMDFNFEGLANFLRELRRDPQLHTTTIIVGGRLFSSPSARAALSEEVAGRKLADHIARDLRSGLEFLDTYERNRTAK